MDLQLIILMPKQIFFLKFDMQGDLLLKKSIVSHLLGDSIDSESRLTKLLLMIISYIRYFLLLSQISNYLVVLDLYMFNLTALILI